MSDSRYAQCTICCYCSIITNNEECQQTALQWESVGSQLTRLQAVWSGVQFSVWAGYFCPLQSTHASFSVGASSPKEWHSGCEADLWPLSDAEVQDDYNYISTPHPPPHMPTLVWTRVTLLLPSHADKIIWEFVQHFSSYLQVQRDRQTWWSSYM